MTRLLVVLVVCATRLAAAQPAKLEASGLAVHEAEPPIIELLTFGVGDVIFEKFGHAALCLRYRDPSNPPVCFNYGVTDFKAGAILVWRFLREEQRFWVEPSTWGSIYKPGSGRPRGMIGFYSWENRDIWSQRLPLSPEQARTVETRLWDSLDEAHRYYTYDHFRDNCTTRLRDLIDQVTGGKLREGTDRPYVETFRDMGRRGLRGMPVLLGLTDFMIGRALDRTPTIWEAMFHPDVLRRLVETNLGVRPELLYERYVRTPPRPISDADGRPQVLLLALAFALPLVFARRLGRQAAKLARLGIPRAAIPMLGVMAFAIGALCVGIGLTIGGALGAAVAIGGLYASAAAVAMSERAALVFATVPLALVGLALWGLAIASPIEGVRWNEVVLVLMPLDALVLILGEAGRRRYAQLRVAGLALVSMLCALGVLRQPLWVPILVAFLPMAVLAFDLPRRLGRRADEHDELPRAVVVESEP